MLYRTGNTRLDGWTHRTYRLYGNEAELQDTTVLVIEFVFGRAKVDKELNCQQYETFEEAHKIQSDSVGGETESALAAIVGREMAAIGELWCLYS